MYYSRDSITNRSLQERYIYKNGYFDGMRDATFNIINGLVDNKTSTGNNTTVGVSLPIISPDSIELANFNENKGATVVKWSDGTITKVKTQNGDTYNPEVGLAI